MVIANAIRRCNIPMQPPYILQEATMTDEKHISIFIWPFYALWKLVSAIIQLTGRLVAVLLGLVLMIVGIILTVTLIGAIIGIHLLIIGFLLVLRGIF